MLREMSWFEFLEWEAFYQLEPFGEIRDDYRAAQIESALYNVWRDTKKHPQPFPIQDFLLKFGEEPKKKQTVEEQKSMLLMIAATYSGEKIPQDAVA